MKILLVILFLFSTNVFSKNICLSAKDIISCTTCCQKIFINSDNNLKNFDKYDPKDCKKKTSSLIYQNPKYSKALTSKTPPGVLFGVLNTAFTFDDLLEFVCGAKNSLSSCVNECETKLKNLKNII